MLEFEIVSYEKIFNFNKKALENLCSSTANAPCAACVARRALKSPLQGGKINA